MTPTDPRRRRMLIRELLAGYADRQAAREARRAEWRRKYQFWSPGKWRKQGRRAG